MSAPATRTSEYSRTFLVVLVIVAAIVAGTIGYLGVSGKIGGQIPGMKSPGGTSAVPPPSCEGGPTTGPHWFSFVAGVPGVNSGINFNGSVPGPCVLVGVGSNVTVDFHVDSNSPLNHSWVLIPASGNATSLPAFPGAGFANATRFSGLAPGDSATFQFTASDVGDYHYICEVPGHDALGMWGWFNVTAAVG